MKQTKTAGRGKRLLSLALVLLMLCSLLPMAALAADGTENPAGTTTITVAGDENAKITYGVRADDYTTGDKYDFCYAPSHTVTVNSNAKLSFYLSVNGYDTTRYILKGLEVNGKTESFEENNYRFNINKTGIRIDTTSSWTSSDHLGESYVIKPIFEERSSEPGENDIKIVIDLTGYTGAVTGTFRTGATTMPVEAGMVNEFMT